MKVKRVIRWALAAITSCIALVGLFVGIVTFYFWWSVEHHRACEFEVNLSEVGEYRGAYYRRYGAPHGLQMRLETGPPFQSDEEMKQALEGLTFTISVGTPEDGSLRQASFGAADFAQRRCPGCTGCVRMPQYTPFIDVGHALDGPWSGEARVVVEEPAAVLKGRKQTLSMVHLYCKTESGLKQIFAGLFLVVGVVCGVVGFRIGKGLRKERRSQAADVSTT